MNKLKYSIFLRGYRVIEGMEATKLRDLKISYLFNFPSCFYYAEFCTTHALVLIIINLHNPIPTTDKYLIQFWMPYRSNNMLSID